MSKLLDIIDRRIDEKNAQQNGLTLAPARVTAVRADFLRADVELLSNGMALKAMLNKTGERLTVGQTVRIAWQTLPSSGWIAVANGEADPLGGSGGGVTVDTAAIVSTAQDFIVTEEVEIDYSPATKVVYGADNTFFVAQEQYTCFRSGSADAYYVSSSAIVAREQYFGDAVYLKGIYRSGSEGDYRYNIIEKSVEFFISKRENYGTNDLSEWFKVKTHDKISTYTTPSSTPTVTQNTYLHYNDTPVYDMTASSTTLQQWTSDWILFIRATSVINKASLSDDIAAFFPAGTDYCFRCYIHPMYNNRGWNVLYGIDPDYVVDATYWFFKNKAEQDFALGITQRSEPVEEE